MQVDTQTALYQCSELLTQKLLLQSEAVGLSHLWLPALTSSCPPSLFRPYMMTPRTELAIFYGQGRGCTTE